MPSSDFEKRRITVRRVNLRNKYGITVEQYDEMFARQDGLCAICERPTKSGRLLSVDHDHETGRVRALLCQGCNRGLGFFSEDPESLRAAADYLEAHANV